MTPLSVAFSNQNLSPLHADIDYMVNIHKIREEGPAKSLALAVHRGPVWVCHCCNMPTIAPVGLDLRSKILTSRASGRAITIRWSSLQLRTARRYFRLLGWARIAYERLWRGNMSVHQYQL